MPILQHALSHVAFRLNPSLTGIARLLTFATATDTTCPLTRC